MGRRLLVLDVDDTLYLERDYVMSGFAAVDAHIRNRIGPTDFLEKALREFQAGERGRIFDRVIEADKVLSDWVGLVPELIGVYRNHRPAISMLTDAVEFLISHSASADFAVVTDGPQVSQHAKVAALGLKRWVSEVVVTADRGDEWGKPSSRAFEYLQDLFQVTPQNCAYFADNPRKDFIGPKLLGWRTFRIRRPGGLHFSLDEDGGADSSLGSFSEVTL